MRHRQVPGCLAIFRVQGTQLKGTMPGGRGESAWTCRPLSRAAAAGRKWVSLPPLLIPLCRGPTLSSQAAAGPGALSEPSRRGSKRPLHLTRAMLTAKTCSQRKYRVSETVPKVAADTMTKATVMKGDQTDSEELSKADLLDVLGKCAGIELHEPVEPWTASGLKPPPSISRRNKTCRGNCNPPGGCRPLPCTSTLLVAHAD